MNLTSLMRNNHWHGVIKPKELLSEQQQPPATLTHPTLNTASSRAQRYKRRGSRWRSLKSIAVLQQLQRLPDKAVTQVLSVYMRVHVCLTLCLSVCVHFNICTNSYQQLAHTHSMFFYLFGERHVA